MSAVGSRARSVSLGTGRRFNAATLLPPAAIAQSRENLRYLEGALTKTRIDEQRKALYELIASQQQKAMLANTQKQFAFKVIDPAVAPDKKSKPKRSLIVVLATFVAGFLAVLAVFVREGMRKRKEEENQPSESLTAKT